MLKTGSAQLSNAMELQLAYTAKHAIVVVRSTVTRSPSASSPPFDFDVLDADFVDVDDFRLLLLGRSSS
eukprot:15991-Heterococcus_DN1.PRE.2